MTAVLLTLGLFAAWCLIGMAVLAAIRADTASLRVALTAPAVGTAASVLPLFALSAAGVAMDTGGLPVMIALVGVSAAVLAVKRPTVPRAVAPALLICVSGLLLAGWPMFGLGFRWIANANDDMANYVLSATYLLHHGLLAPVDLVGLSHNRDYASATAVLHRVGSRPGADITLAALSAVTRRPPAELFMSLILSLNLCAICATGALAMQATRRWWAALVAAALIAVSPQATYGVLAQLLPQVWGLGLATALCALLMRRELHRSPGPGVQDVALISILAAALIAVYVELASTLALAYALYLGLLALRREVDLRVATRLWIPVLALTVIVLNTYLLREFHYVTSQTSTGIHGVFAGPPNWGYTLTPSGLSGIVGFQKVPINGDAPFLTWSILAAAILLAGAFAASLLGALRGIAASVVLVAYAALGIYLAVKSSDFGLFKIYMYVQPFLAASVAIWLATATRVRAFALVAIPLALLLGFQASTQQAYVRYSRNPLDLPHASAQNLLPALRRLVAEGHQPVILVTENSVLGKLGAASAGRRPLYFVDQNFFSLMTSNIAARLGWRRRSFKLVGSGAEPVNVFWENIHTSAAFSAKRCTIVLPTGSQTVVNRRALPEGFDNLVAKPCATARNMLVFTASTLGWGYFGFGDRNKVGFYPPQDDYFFPGHTMSAFGRYALFRILRPSPRIRLEISLTTTLLRETLAPAAVVGTNRVRLPLLGRGSARVFSIPFHPQIINGRSYALLDMGRAGGLPSTQRSGIEGLYGRGVPLDPRYLTAFIRDVSVLSSTQYRRLRRPFALTSFPRALANQDLEYSGIGEDGWVGNRSYAVLAGGAAADLLVRAEVPPAPGGQRLRVFVNGRQVAARTVAPGHLDLRVAVPTSGSPRRVELRWASAPPLPAPDGRPVSALLQFLGVVAHVGPPSVVQHFPHDLTAPGVSSSGIWLDGWLKRRSSVTLAGGAAADLLVRAEVPPAPGGQRLRVFVNGRQVAARTVAPGHLDLRVAVPTSGSPRRVELRWASAPPLPAPDGRPVSALLEYLGIV